MAGKYDFWNGRVGIVTGSTGEIGTAICERLVSYGIKLVLTGRDAMTLEQTAQSLRDKGGEVSTIIGNLEELDFLLDVVNFTVDTYGQIDLVVNNAGQAHKSSIEDVSPETFEKIMNVNVRAPYFLTQHAIPYLQLSDVATIINTCSVVAHRGYSRQSVFTISKHAMLGLSKAMAIEVQEKGIRVHAISPGAVHTGLVELLRPDLEPGELILPSDIGDVVGFFLEHRKSNFVVDEMRMHRIGKEPFL